MNRILIATILLEKNRWGSREPSYQVSEWSERFRADGFDGMELWEEHATKCSAHELERLKNASLPVAVFNTYSEFTDDGAEKRLKAADMVKRLGAAAVKYNFGNEKSLRGTYIRNLKEWASLLPNDCRILCECHEGTVMEDPEEAAGILKEIKDERFRLIAHTFGHPDLFEKWLKTFGSAISHVHLFNYDANMVPKLLGRTPENCIACLKLLKKYNYKCDFTLEFTEGIRTPCENIEDLYRCALEDLKFIKEYV